MLTYAVHFYGQMLVHLRLSVLLSLMSHIVSICTIIFELINDDDDGEEVGTLVCYSLLIKPFYSFYFIGFGLFVCFYLLYLF